MRRLPLALTLLLAAGLAGCAEDLLPPPVAGPVPAACADRPLGELGRTAADPDWGCADAANLAAMVANPADLHGGAEAAAPSGDAALIAIRRHRAGAVKTLPGMVGGPTAPPSLEGAQ